MAEQPLTKEQGSWDGLPDAVLPRQITLHTKRLESGDVEISFGYRSYPMTLGKQQAYSLAKWLLWEE